MTVIIAENGILTVRELVQNVGARIEFARSKLVRKTAARPKTGAPQDTRVTVDVHAHAAVGIVIVTLQERGLNLHLRFDEESRFMAEGHAVFGGKRRVILIEVARRAEGGTRRIKFGAHPTEASDEIEILISESQRIVERKFITRHVAGSAAVDV